MIIKLPKRPDSIFNNEHLFNYLLDLERKQKLNILPANLMVYYVFSTFVNEVLNGGLVQYFTNSSKLTYIHLRQCAILLNHEAFTPYVLEVCDYVDSIPSLDFDNEIDQAIAEQLDVFNNQFYELDEKFDALKITEKFYKNNYSIEKIDIPKIKEIESSSCKYFIAPKDLICKNVEDAIESFLKVLADFSEQRWTIDLWNFFDTYRITASTYGKAIDLETVMLHWADSTYSFSNSSNDGYNNRIKLSSAFEKISIMSGTDGISEYAVRIFSSGFEKNEFKMKHQFVMAGRAYDQEISAISVGDMSHKKDPEKYYIIKNYLESHYKEYKNIETVFETGEY